MSSHPAHERPADRRTGPLTRQQVAFTLAGTLSEKRPLLLRRGMALSTHSNWSAAVATFITVLTERPVDPAVVAFVVVIRVLTMLVQGRRAALLWAGIEIVMMLVMASTWYLDWQPHWLPTAGAAVPCASLLLAVRVRHLQLRDRHS